jgi:hypothetical protein|tara:strand:- start:4508 stop:6157 length:1650 start_codon:yes stop_codon:yes gene_type:complete
MIDQFMLEKKSRKNSTVLIENTQISQLIDNVTIYLTMRNIPKAIAVATKATKISLSSKGRLIEPGAFIVPLGEIVTTSKATGIEVLEKGIHILEILGGVLFTIENNMQIKPMFLLSHSEQRIVDTLTADLPMLELPLDWSANKGGYYLNRQPPLLGKAAMFIPKGITLSTDVLNKLQTIPWTTSATNSKLTMFNQAKLYFVWKYDSRGRGYSTGWPLNIQSSQRVKATLSLFNKELINDYDNIYIAIANHAGKDKLSWEDRIAWTRSSLNTIIDGKIKWDEPHLGRKAVKALLDTIDDQPTGYWMTLDATASGIQIMAALSGCKETASATNMVDPAVRRDLYQEVTTAINSLCTIPTTRKVVKKVVMTFFYNSVKTPERMLTKDQLAAFYEVIQQLFPGAYKVMDIVNKLWNTNGSHHKWTLPDGHVAHVPVLGAVKYNTPYGNIHRTELVTSPNYRSLLPNVIHSIDGYIAREMIRRCDFEVIHIHDCFGSHPNNMGMIAQRYREILAEISDSSLLNSIVKELSMGKSWFPIFPSLKHEILNSNYMLS